MSLAVAEGGQIHGDGGLNGVSEVRFVSGRNGFRTVSSYVHVAGRGGAPSTATIIDLQSDRTGPTCRFFTTGCTQKKNG